jgi:hypothetical protein
MSDQLKFCYTNKTKVPDGGWWVDWEGQTVRGGDWVDLVKNCHMLIIRLGKIPPINLPQQVEDLLCARLAGNTNCVPCSRGKQTLGFREIARWVRAMYHFAKENKFELVSQEVAEQRAEICAKCPLQISTSGCWGCKGIAGMLPAIAGARKTPFDQQLKACGVCGCYNAVSVHLPLETQKDASLVFPDHCWKKAQNE